MGTGAGAVNFDNIDSDFLAALANASATEAPPEDVLYAKETEFDTYYQSGGMGGTAPSVRATETKTEYVTLEDVFNVIETLDESDRKLLAMEMFVSVPSAYRDYEEIFNDDGSLNDVSFAYAINRTIGFAGTYAAINDPFFVDILTRESLQEFTAEEIKSMFEAKVAKIQEEQKGAPRVIRYVDPAALTGMLEQSYAAAIGRKPRDEEIRAFVGYFHGLQASNPDMQLSPQAQATQFASDQAPGEAGAMEYVNANKLIMSALGMGAR
jgi:hypothetical protein